MKSLGDGIFIQRVLRKQAQYTAVDEMPKGEGKGMGHEFLARTVCDDNSAFHAHGRVKRFIAVELVNAGLG